MIFQRQRRRHESLRFEVIPIIDVMFTLLIFFAIFISIVSAQVKSGLNMNLPVASSAVPVQKTVTLSIDSDGVIQLENVAIELEVLSQKIADLITKESKPKVIVQADKSLPYDTVIQILDQVRIGGCYDVVLQTVRQQRKP
jgi:biopolymer transport protein ExbD